MPKFYGVVCLSMGLHAAAAQSTSGIKTHYPVDSTRTGYVDFHNHTTMKPFVTKVEVPFGTPKRKAAAALLRAAQTAPDTLVWTLNTRGEQDSTKDGNFSDFGGYRQSAWYQLRDYHLICTSLYEYERGLVVDAWGPNRLLKSFASRFGIHLPLNRRKLVRNKHVTAHDELEAEYAFATRQRSSNPDHPEEGPRVLVMKSRSNITDLQPGQTGLVFSIEGGHALFDKGPRLQGRLLEDKTTPDDVAALQRNIAALKRWEHPVLFVTLSHLIWNKLAGQGKGTDIEGSLQKPLHKLNRSARVRAGANTLPATGITGVSGFSKDTPVPWATLYDNGLTGQTYDDALGLGKLVIDSLLSRHGGRILIDLRHSGIKTRLEYYALVQQRRQRGDTIPIIISHAAMSGKSLRFALATGLRPRADDYAEFFDPVAYYHNPSYFPWQNATTLLPTTVIPTSRGLSRIFDRGTITLPTFPLVRKSFRIDGVTHYYREFFRPQPNRTDTLSYLRPSDFPDATRAGFFQPSSINLADEEIDIVCQSGGIIGLTVEQRGLGTPLPQAQQERGKVEEAFRRDIEAGKVKIPVGIDKESYIQRFLVVAPFVRNLNHLVHAAARHSDVWRHVAIGTDFDGIINPLDYFHTSDRLPELEQFIYDNFEHYEKYYGFQLQRALANTPGTAYSKQQALRMLFSLNGSAFIARNFPR